MLPTEASAALRAAPNSAAPIICIGGRGAVNQVAAALMAQQLVLEGIAAETGSEQGIPALASPVDGKRPAPLVCLTYVGEVRTAQARYNIRRTKGKHRRQRLAGSRVCCLRRPDNLER